jgi:hypothetical protein
MPTVLREGPYSTGTATSQGLFRGQYTHFCGRLCFFADSAPVSPLFRGQYTHFWAFSGDSTPISAAGSAFSLTVHPFLCGPLWCHDLGEITRR